MKKGPNVIRLFKADEITNITAENIGYPVEPGKVCDIKVIEMFNSKGISPKVAELFSEEIEIIKRIPNVSRALYIFMEPHTVIPEHNDDDDPSFRIVIGVYPNCEYTGKISLGVEQDDCIFGHKKLVGFSSMIMHHGENNTDDLWSVLTLCLDHPELTSRHKVYESRTY